METKKLRNKGIVRRALPLAAVGLVVLAGIGFASFGNGRSNPAQFEGAATTVVQRGPLTISLTETGTVRPREQVILKNDLDDPATILFIVPEGAEVKKGDLLVELDATRWEDFLIERRIRVQNSRAEWISAEENLAVVMNQAQSDTETAELELRFAGEDLQKYLKGEYPNTVKELEVKITLAEEELTNAARNFEWSKKLYEQKYVSQSDLLRDDLAHKKAQLNLELAQNALKLNQEYNHKRQLDQLESDQKQAELALERERRKARANNAQADARLQAAKAEYEEDFARVTRLEELVGKAKMIAPIDGVVLYATSVSDDWRNDNDPIEVGVTMDEREEIIYLPTRSAYNVDIKIPEVNLNKIRTALPVEVKVDALQGRTFAGTVTSISPVPDPDRRSLNPNLKVYNTVIELSEGMDVLRNGMSCHVRLIVEELKEAVYVPVQTVVSPRGQPVVSLPPGIG